MSELNTFTMEWEILGEEGVNFSLEFAGTPGDGWGYSAGYGGGDKQPGAGEDVVDFNGVYNGSDCFPMTNINKIQFFFDSGYDAVTTQTVTHSNTILIKSIKLTYKEPLTEATVPADAVLTNATVGAISTDPAESSTLAASAEDGVYTIERTAAAPSSGDYGNHVNLAFDGVIPETRWIELTLGEGTSFNMLMIWLDANSGNGKGKMIIESVKFYAPVGTELPAEPAEPDYGTLIEDTVIGDLWKNETVTTLTTDNDSKTVTRTTEASASGDYGNSVALNYTGMSADCRKIVITLGEGTSCNMVMFQVQDGAGAEIVKKDWGACHAGDQLVIELTEEQAQAMCDTPAQYFMIWLDANGGNGCGTLVIESVQFFAAAE